MRDDVPHQVRISECDVSISVDDVEVLPADPSAASASASGLPVRCLFPFTIDDTEATARLDGAAHILTLRLPVTGPLSATQASAYRAHVAARTAVGQVKPKPLPTPAVASAPSLPVLPVANSFVWKMM